MEIANTTETITLDEDKRIVSAAEEKAQEIGCPMDIAVVDAGRNFKAHVRMDGANIGSILISINKGYTAVAFQGETGNLQEMTARTARSTASATHTEDASLSFQAASRSSCSCARAGIVGAIGISTGTIKQDQEVAEAGVTAF